MLEISKLDQKQALERAKHSSMFAECAKLMIHIRPQLNSRDTVYGILKSQGVRVSTINNAAQAERVWNEYVKPGYCDEVWFDKLSYANCVAINAVTRDRGREFTKSIIGDLLEIRHIYETGQTCDEFKTTEAAKNAALAAMSVKKTDNPAAP